MKRKQSNLPYQVLLIAGMAIFYFIYIDKVFPASEEWHITNVMLMQQGKMPYRDFYYYLPPLDLFVTRLMWAVSNGSYLIYRIWRLFERILIVEIMFLLLQKYTKKSIAFIACLTGGIMFSACVYDLGGDYNQTGFVIIALCIHFLVGFVSSETSKQRFLYAFLTGVCLGGCFLSKQTYFVACFLVLSFCLLFYCIVNKEQKGWLYFLFAAIGTLLPIGICAAWLFLNQALVPFIEQVFINTDSKGSLMSIIIGSVFRLFLDKGTLPLLIFSTLLSIYAWNLNWIQKKTKLPKALVQFAFWVGLFICAFLFWRLIDVYPTSLHSMLRVHYLTGLAVLVGLPLLSGIAYSWINSKKEIALFFDEKKRGVLSAILILAFVLVLVLIAYLNPKLLARDIYESESVFYNFTTLLQRCMAFLVVIPLLYYMVKCVKNKDNKPWIWFFLFGAAFTVLYSSTMASGSSIAPPYYMVIAVPIVTVWLFSIQVKHEYMRNTMLIGLCMMNVLIVGCQKSMCSYSWWGWAETPIQDHTETIDIAAMRGFRVNEQTKTLYEKITHVIEENSNEDSSVLGYPHNVVFNQLSGRNQMDRFVPVYFYDVCAAQYVVGDVEILVKNPPDIIIWQDIPYCYDTHSEVFNGGQKLAQYAFEEWFSIHRNTEYELIGQVMNVYVYKLKNNGIPTRYTYIEDEMQTNFTASVIERFSDSEKLEAALISVEKQFVGSGTAGDPYQVSCAKDLLQLSQAVQQGILFENAFFVQTKDVDMRGIDWMPIGQYGSGCYFCGTYNGDGHIIKNLKCAQDNKTGFSGLFGSLAGTVINLGICNAEFLGNIVGAIAANAYGTSLIQNCYVVDSVLEASKLAGGIAAEFTNGSIINCFTDNVVKKAVADNESNKNTGKEESAFYGISKSWAYIENCYSTAYVIGEENGDYLRSSLQCTTVRKDEATLEDVAMKLNQYIELSSIYNLNYWGIENHQLILEQERNWYEQELERRGKRAEDSLWYNVNFPAVRMPENTTRP